jgi:hypothetical protein
MSVAMRGDRSRYGLLVSTLGAIVLAVAVFLPWYNVSFTPAGTSVLTRAGDQFAAQFGNPSLQSYVGGLHGTIAALAGRQAGAISGHEALRDLNVVLLVLAGLALLDALLPLARTASGVPDGAGGAVVLLGLLASVCVAYRMAFPPSPAGDLLALSVREGAWLALLGSLMMMVGGLWPRALSGNAPGEAAAADVWASLSGWTPSR